MANTSYDTLTIKIKTDTTSANTNVKNFSSNLQKLNELAKTIDTRRIGEVRNLLKSIAKIDFTNVSKGLSDVVSAFKSLNAQSSKSFKSDDLGEQAQKQTEKVASAFEVLQKKTKGSEDELKNYFASMDLTLGQTNTLISGLNERFDPISKEKVQEIKAHLKELGYSIHDIDKALDRVNKTAKKTKGVGSIIKIFIERLFKAFKTSWRLTTRQPTLSIILETHFSMLLIH